MNQMLVLLGDIIIKPFLQSSADLSEGTRMKPHLEYFDTLQKSS